MLPYVQAERSALAEKASVGAARSFLDCSTCQARTAPAARQLWNCGHLPRLPGNRYQGPTLSADLAPDTVCPGYLITLPQVVEATRAFGWSEKGQLREFCDGETPTELLRVCVEVLGGVTGEAQITKMREAREEAVRESKRGGR